MKTQSASRAYKAADGKCFLANFHQLQIVKALYKYVAVKFAIVIKL